MKPKKLTLCGWGPYRDEIEIDFTPYEAKGIFLITGATGAGKTTLFDAVTYALYGALSGEVRDKERGSVRSDFADGDTPTYVELVMEHAGQVYRIRRNPEYLRPKKRSRGDGGFAREKENAVLYLPDDTAIEGVREVNARLRELLGLDHSQFKQISMIAQGEFARLLTAPPRDKTRIFREIFGTGIYERFTAALGERSRALYGRYMERKHKLEEDVRLLTVGLERSGFSRGQQDRLNGLAEAGNWNYEELADCLQELERTASEYARDTKADYRKAERQGEKLSEKLTRLREEAKQLERYYAAREERTLLIGRSREIRQKEKRFQAAQNAGWVESARERSDQATVLLGKNRAEQEELRRECAELIEEADMLRPAAERQREISELLDKALALREKESAGKKARLLLEKKERELNQGQRRFLDSEERCLEKKSRFEEADRKRKLEAIGIAAGLLEAGKPCPVCGSTTHPAPAVMTGEVMTEEELEKLKRELETAQSGLQDLHGAVVAAKTQADALRLEAETMESEADALRGELEETARKEALPFLAMEPAEAKARLQRLCARAQQLGGLLEEKEKRLGRLREEQGTLAAAAETTRKALAAALAEYGFKDNASYEAARLEAAEREALKAELETYRQRVAANQELYQHLKAVLPSQKPEPDVFARELQELEKELERQRAEKKKLLEEQKRWERQLHEVQKTRKQFAEKREGMEREHREYGYVKDLENAACGNNGKKLVFEQYVLAGYFEEILRAANLRFTKMTAGRYEMSRAAQVGDGRVKDNLEIQVLDNYTGKYRSVRTLSGGESFKASLALALGLSDVIQSMNGGVRVDTLFIDEGFGALDEESLDQACETLMGLVEKNRLIGIISHVPELRERIGNQMIVDKSGGGSRVRCRVG